MNFIKKAKVKGFTLLELVVAMAILLSSSSLFVSIVANDFRLIKTQDELYNQNEIINIIKNEIKYNVSSCDLVDYFQRNLFIYLEIDDLVDKILKENIFNIAKNQFENKKSIKITLNEVLENQINLTFEIVNSENEVITSEVFEKKIWMENI